MDESTRGVVLVASPLSEDELKSIAQEGFGDMLKAVVDVNLKIMAVGGELHADIRPTQGNRSRWVEEETIRTQILEIVEGLVK